MNKRIYVTTAIPYVNSAPHIGFALEIIQADVIARYNRLIGNDVYFLTGTDENALKNVKAAEKEGLSTKTLVDKYAAQFLALKKTLNLSFDDFIRTTEKRHFLGSQKFWQSCKKDIYKKTYKGWYCIGCEEFKTAKDLVNNKCPEHPNRKLEFVEEKNYFFSLSKYQNQIQQLIETDKLKIIPLERKNEVLAFIKNGLKDFSISRSKKRAKGWGIPVPGDEDQFIYVWFDALLNYITALGYTNNAGLYKKFWLNNNNIIHCIGKGIIRFHAIYWPAMLLSAGLPLPTTELVHGYITANGQKMSKSLGNVFSPFDLVKNYGTDALRYYLLKEIPTTSDGDFTLAHFKEVYNADLANGLGNLIQRVSKLCEKVDKIKAIKKRLSLEIGTSLLLYEFNRALNLIWEEIRNLDKEIDQTKPWEKDKQELENLLISFVSKLLQIACNLKPLLPETADKIETIFTASKIKAPKKPLFLRV